MISQTAYAMGAAPNEIRQIFEYGRQQAKLLGEDKVFDFSLGNPAFREKNPAGECLYHLRRCACNAGGSARPQNRKQ